MRAIMQFLMQSFVGAVSLTAIWLVSFFIYGQTVLLTSLFAAIGGVLTYAAAKQIMDYRFVRSQGLTKKEYKFIDTNLKEARGKITRMQKALFKVRSFQHARENLAIVRTAQKIYNNARKEPVRFYQAESFFYNHLDSLVELSERYAYLSSQPSPSIEMQKSLKETRQTLTAFSRTIKKDLQVMLRDDLETLDFELDVAKQTLRRSKK
ncbi:5-bromo-4-chloroindolyl phosphate hydrolysis family protein [Oceanobacillus sojae]|uniref:5-bromo-4-chloroindolyl phosphate hydrolysis family protein n=1 Tax=Oceanobacillus sojae TaxID=582851 RepID=UPI0009882DE5|nr:5-bromo-4-chloroindolyl phosphate hydrolysis family protein [Oceanobacillus sojae]MCT1902179.1 5-bromo-4-chloroindolyl phosphate hydrolysis family protein [Oceanobacillus sojae]